MHLGGMQQSDSLHMVTDEKHMKTKKRRTSIQANRQPFNHKPFTKSKDFQCCKRLSPGDINGKAFTSRNQKKNVKT